MVPSSFGRLADPRFPFLVDWVAPAIPGFLGRAFLF